VFYTCIKRVQVLKIEKIAALYKGATSDVLLTTRS